MSDDAGAKVEGPFIYGPYGSCFQGTTPCAQLANSVPYKFTSRRLDPETELYYYRARMYWGTGGRFLQTDPVGYTADLNLYTYVGNDPTDERDPTGEAVGLAEICPEDPTCKGTGTRPVETVVVTAMKKPQDLRSPVQRAGAIALPIPNIGGAARAIPVIGALGPAAVVVGASAPLCGDSPGCGATINRAEEQEREYTQHAKDRMKEQNVSKDRVEEAIEKGRSKPGNTEHEVVKELPASQSESGRGIRVVLDKDTGRVVTVTDKGSRFR